VPMPCSPVIPNVVDRLASQEVLLAENQPEYIALPSIISGWPRRSCDYPLAVHMEGAPPAPLVGEPMAPADDLPPKYPAGQNSDRPATPEEYL